MMRSVVALLVAAACGLAQMPIPAKTTPGLGHLAIDSTFSIAISGHSDARLEAAAKRLTARIARQTGIPTSPGTGPRPATLTVQCDKAGPEYPSLNEDESYQLEISLSSARLTAPTTTGALRGLETFAQLISPGSDGFQIPAVRIDDRPRFPWRGLMLDVSRHWMPVEVIKRNLAAMAAVKLNVFHWHLSDDQGFRVESKQFPRLHQLGSDGDFYTQSEIRDIVNYARDRAIRVIPEFDIPGHTTSWFVAYPELASAPGPYAIERKWGIFEPTLDPSREETYAFLDTFLGEMAALFPDPYFHIGGDEVNDTQWRLSASIQAFARQHGLVNSQELHAYFNQRVERLLKKHGKIMIGWDEVLHPGLASETVIQSWRGQQSLADAARKGYRGVLSFGYYLDHLQSAGFHYQNDPLDGDARESNTEQASKILGGEACMWSEYVSPETVDSRIWPRAAAIAERLWSPRDAADVDSMYSRLERVSWVLDSVGAEHRSNYARMLERLAGGRSNVAVRSLADAVEALGIEGRRDARKYTSQVPLNRLVDAARPESETARSLEAAARAANLSPLRVAFTEWTENHALLIPMAQDNFLIHEMLPISEELSTVGSIGLRALDFLQSGRAAPEAWVVEQKQTLAKIGGPKSEVTIAAVRPVRILLDTIARRGTPTGAAR